MFCARLFGQRYTISLFVWRLVILIARRISLHLHILTSDATSCHICRLHWITEWLALVFKADQPIYCTLVITHLSDLEMVHIVLGFPDSSMVRTLVYKRVGCCFIFDPIP